MALPLSLSPPRGRHFSDSMDYDDELAELHDRRERELLASQSASQSQLGLGHGHGHTLSHGHGHGNAVGLGVGLGQVQGHGAPLPPGFALRESDEDTEDASEDGDAGAGRQCHPKEAIGVCPPEVEMGEEGEGVGDADGDGDDDDGDGDVDDGQPGPSGSGVEIKEQVYFDKLNLLKANLEELEAGNHLEYNLGLQRLQQNFHDRLESNAAWEDYQVGVIERDFSAERLTIVREFEDKKIELRESLVANQEEKRKAIDMDRYAMELSTDPSEVKPMSTRKLRRRPNEPAPLPEKRRKAPQSQITFLLEDKEIDDDLRSIALMVTGKVGKKSEGYHRGKAAAEVFDYSGENAHTDSRIEDGKLFYEKRWFHRGQPVYVEGSGMTKIGGVICSISQDLVWVRKVNEVAKIRVPISSLQNGKLKIKRRAN